MASEQTPRCDWGDWDKLVKVEAADYRLQATLSDGATYTVHACLTHLLDMVRFAIVQYETFAIEPVDMATVTRLRRPS